MPANKVAPVLVEELYGLCSDCIRICSNEARIIEDDRWKNIAVTLSINCSVRKEVQIFI